jgi:hypothetical protein
MVTQSTDFPAGSVCAVHITAELAYDADPGTVFAMICDVGFQERKCRANGALEHEVEIKEYEDGGALVTTHRTLPADGIPDFISSFVGGALRVSQTDDWAGPGSDGSRRGTAVVEIAGAPIRFTAALQLAANGSGSRQSVAGDLKASIPLVGGRIEKAAEPAIRAAIRAEQRTSTAWLAGD